MQAGTLLAPAFAVGNGNGSVDKFAPRPFGVALPGDVGEAVIDVDGPRLAVEPQTTPVPELEGVDVGRGADLEHDDARAGTVYRAAWNQEVIVNSDRPLVDIGVSRERRASGELSGPKIGSHGFSVDTGLQAEIYRGIRSGRQYIVAFVLSISDPEFIAHIG